MAAHAGPPFGRLLTAMVTPFAPDGSVDLDAAAASAAAVGAATAAAAAVG